MLPRIALGTWPTPVRRLEETSASLGAEVWVKSEESCGAWGGNKVRKLEYILADLERRGPKHVVTYGAATSSWTAAVALHARPRGFEVHLGLGGTVPPPNTELYDRTGTHVYAMPSYNHTPLAAARARLAAGLRDVVRLPAGGSGLPGDVGSMHAGSEIAASVRSGELPPIKTIYVPSGTSGTSAGIAVGLGVEGLHPVVHAVRVTPRPLGTPALVRRHASRLMHFLQRRGLIEKGSLEAPITGDGRFFPPAYGAGNAASEEAIELGASDGLVLDPTYAAKAFAALVADLRSGARGPVLFVHTSPSAIPTQ